MFPAEILPNWLRAISLFLPTTHALKALRLTLAGQTSLPNLQGEIQFLFITMALTLPLGVCVFQMGLKKAKREGSLSQY